MAERHLTENHRKETNCLTSQEKGKKFLQFFPLIALLLVRVGYTFAIYKENERNISTYSLLDAAFSLVNFNVLCGIEKIDCYSIISIFCIEIFHLYISVFAEKR